MDGYTDIGFRVMGSERRKKTRVSQDRTTTGKKKEKKEKKTNGGRRLRNDNAKLRDRSGKGEPRAGLLRESLLDKSVRKWNGEPRPGKISTFVEARWWGPIWKRKGRPLLSRMLVSRGIWTAAAACGNSGRPRWKSQRGARGKCPLSFYGQSFNEICELRANSTCTIIDQFLVNFIQIN